MLTLQGDAHMARRPRGCQEQEVVHALLPAERGRRVGGRIVGHNNANEALRDVRAAVKARVRAITPTRAARTPRGWPAAEFNERSREKQGYPQVKAELIFR